MSIYIFIFSIFYFHLLSFYKDDGYQKRIQINKSKKLKEQWAFLLTVKMEQWTVLSSLWIQFISLKTTKTFRHCKDRECSEWVKPDWGSGCGDPATSCVYLLSGCESKGSLYRPQRSASVLNTFSVYWSVNKTSQMGRQGKTRVTDRVVVVFFFNEIPLLHWRLWFLK